MEFIDGIIEEAKQNIKKIVLPEAKDLRVLKAASKLHNEKIANIVLIGDVEEVNKLANENEINISEIEIINPKTSEKNKEYANVLYKLRKAKGMTKEEAKELINDEVYFGMLMV